MGVWTWERRSGQLLAEMCIAQVSFIGDAHVRQIFAAAAFQTRHEGAIRNEALEDAIAVCDGGVQLQYIKVRS